MCPTGREGGGCCTRPAALLRACPAPQQHPTPTPAPQTHPHTLTPNAPTPPTPLGAALLAPVRQGAAPGRPPPGHPPPREGAGEAAPTPSHPALPRITPHALCHATPRTPGHSSSRATPAVPWGSLPATTAPQCWPARCHPGHATAAPREPRGTSPPPRPIPPGHPVPPLARCPLPLQGQATPAAGQAVTLPGRHRRELTSPTLLASPSSRQRAAHDAGVGGAPVPARASPCRAGGDRSGSFTPSAWHPAYASGRAPTLLQPR